MIQTYIIHNKVRPLSYFHPNNNFCGGINDILGFSNKSFMTFESEKEAHEYLRYMFNCHTQMEGDLKLAIKTFKVMEKLKIRNRTEA